MSLIFGVGFLKGLNLSYSSSIINAKVCFFVKLSRLNKIESIEMVLSRIERYIIDE